MIHEIADVLAPQEVIRLKEIAAKTKFIDGRISNPHNQTKNNLQADYADAGFRESSTLLAQALWRHQDFRNYAFPKRLAPPLLCRYQQGMNYGAHSDSAYLPMQPEPLRSDVSCTIWLSEPGSYDGGELVLHLGTKAIPIKGAAGSAVVYPSTTIHEVKPVTRGERFVAITFVESQIIEERYRELLYSLGEIAALEGLTMKWENRVRLEQVRQNLHRIWSS